MESVRCIALTLYAGVFVCTDKRGGGIWKEALDEGTCGGKARGERGERGREEKH